MFKFLQRLEPGIDKDIKKAEKQINRKERKAKRSFYRLLILLEKKKKFRKESKTLSSFKAMLSINDKISAELKRLNVKEINERQAIQHSLGDFLLTHPQIAIESNEKAEVEEMEKYITSTLFEVKTLAEINDRQNKALKKLLTNKDWNEQDPNYLILLETKKAEKTIGNNIIMLIFQAMTKKKRLEADLENTGRELRNSQREDQTEINLSLKSVTFQEIIGKGKIFNGFYDIYKKAFPPEERESKQTLLNDLNSRFKEDTVDMTAHLIGAFLKGECVGGIYFVNIFHQKFSFGIIFWIVLMPEYRGVKLFSREGRKLDSIGEKLVKRAELTIQSNAKTRGLSANGMFAELNDPSKMTGDEIVGDVMNPHFRIKFWHKVGYKSCFKNYVQLLSYDHDNPVEEQVVSTYCNLFVKPMILKWKLFLPKDDLRDVIFSLSTIVNDWPQDKLEDFYHYREMVKKINSAERHFLKEPKHKKLESIVKTYRPNDYYKPAESSPIFAN